MQRRHASPLARRVRAAVSLAAVAAVPLALLTGATTAQAAVPSPPSGFTTVWSDDFTGASGTGLNRTDWLYDIGHGYPGGASNWGTGEIEYMTDSTANVYQDGAGRLAIKPIRDASGGWTSGRVETQRTSFEAPAGGVLRVEASIQQPDVTTANGAGYWPAFWMLGAAARGTGATGWPSIGEIDILENINGRASHFAAIHCGTNPGGPCNETTGIGSGERTCAGCGTSFHTYATEIDRSVSPEQVRFYRDGSNYFTVSANQVDATTWNNAIHHGFFLILNVAIGGGFPDAFGGGPNASTVSGRPMLVDYVTVATKGGSTGGGGATPGASGPVRSAASGKCLDVAGGSSASGTAVQLYDCNGTAAQVWTAYSDGTLRALGKCLDADAWGTSNGTKLILWDCGTNQSNQKFEAYNGGYRNPVSGRCVDNPSGGTTNGARIQLWDCNGSSAQKWSTPGGTVETGGGTGGTVSATSTIQAESRAAQSGTITETTTDTGGGQNVAAVSNGDWLRFDNVAFPAGGVSTFSARAASGAGAGVSGLVEVRLDSATNPVIGSFAIASTGGWQTWRTVPAAVSSVTGTHTVYLTFSTGSGQDFVNVNWFTFS